VNQNSGSEECAFGSFGEELIGAVSNGRGAHVAAILRRLPDETGPAYLKRVRHPILQARRLLESEAFVLDTETTGLGDTDQAIHVAVVSLHGRIVLNTYLRPSVPIHPKAHEQHGLTEDDLRDAPTGRALMPFLYDLFTSHSVCAYNASFDCRILNQTAAACGHTLYNLTHFQAQCVMRLYARLDGEWSSKHGNYCYVKLEKAARDCGLPQRRAHDALEDCLTTADLVRHMAEQVLPRL